MIDQPANTPLYQSFCLVEVVVKLKSLPNKDFFIDDKPANDISYQKISQLKLSY